ncbi:type II secretion system protein GspC [Salinivibrio sp. IB872]|uniref:type II secretion system protein GspC n=1 Tax=Salinivibrio sp. IB872 TaxID=1766123 RepID=UPI000987C978|nr:type II secretion system protein GspC [Salinivibrio sp. IB872]OOF28145.1 type II secretion system protein GspC [Salinivibrio sp. IB872]
MVKKAINGHSVTQFGLEGMMRKAGRQHGTFTVSPQQVARLATWLNILLFLVLAWLAGRMVWAFYAPAPAPVLPVASQSASSSRAATDPFSLAPIVNAQLFGRYQAAAQPTQHAVTNVPETRLRLTLVGVVASNDPKRALAVIANGGRQVTYGVGEQVKGTQVSVDQVLSDRVILRQGSRREALLMPGVDADSTPQTVFSSPTDASTPPKSMATKRQTSPDWPADLAQQLSQNPQRLFDFVQLSQVREGDQIKGFRLTPGRNPIFFEQSGLQAGDIAVAINGLTLSQSAALPDILGRIQQQGSLDLVIERQGQQHEISIQF